jgi:hypothetical protein
MMNIVDLNGIVSEDEIPVCPICGSPIQITDTVLIAQALNELFLVHVYCGDIEFYDA